jgi:hypothetical protein
MPAQAGEVSRRSLAKHPALRGGLHATSGQPEVSASADSCTVELRKFVAPHVAGAEAWAVSGYGHGYGHGRNCGGGTGVGNGYGYGHGYGSDAGTRAGRSFGSGDIGGGGTLFFSFGGGDSSGFGFGDGSGDGSGYVAPKGGSV